MNSNFLTLCISIFLFNINGLAQTVVNGKVSDYMTIEPLIGATVLVKGTTLGTTTNSNGNFKLDYNGGLPLTLIFRYVGYYVKEVVISENKPLDVYLEPSTSSFNEMTVTARRRSEEAQKIPIAIAVIGAKELDNSISFNVNRVKELVPSVQLYSSNPRNTTLNIRGIGSTFGLTNDGIDPGVGFYVDGVYYARPAAATLDFIDVQQIEVLRGPQGTLFGKNTTAGTFNISSRKPTFNLTGILEQSFGNYGFIQTKSSISGPLLTNKLAVRLSFTGTQRDGNIYNLATSKYTNTLNNQGVRMQLLFCPKENFNITLSGDLTRQRPDGYAQVYAGSVTTQRETFRQFEKIIADLNYSLPSQNPFDRLIDHETPWRSDQDMGGVSLNIDLKSRRGTFTSTTAWRKWIWNPSNDRDYTGLQALALSQAPSIHNQWSQEVRFAGNFNKKLSGVVGVFGFFQELEANGFHREESGRDQWRFVQTSQSALWQTPGLLNGYGIKTKPSFRNFSGAIFSQIDWSLNQKISILPGVRLNYDQKFVDFRREVYGGLQTSDTTLLALQRTVYNNQYFNASINDWNVSGQITVNFNVNDWIRFYVTNSVGIKPIGLNLGGLPTQNGEPIIDLAVIKPEKAYHFEIGIKTEPSKSSFVNFTIFNTDIYNYQALVQSPQLGVNRGYLANAEHVRTRGIELEASYAYSKILRVVGSLIYTDGKYVSFQNAPLPLEETGQKVNGVQVAFKDISGGKLPGISTWSFSTGFESTIKGELIGQQGDYFFAADLFYRSPFSSSPSPSKYLNINGYFLVNARMGFRTQKGLTIYIWTRNLANINYFEQLLPAAGNAGQFAAVLGDPRTYGITLRFNFF